MEQRPTTQTINLDDEPILDVKAAGYFLGYVVRSVKRRRRLVVMTVAATALLVLALAVVLPRIYKVQTRILTHRSLTLMGLVAAEGAPSDRNDNPTAGTHELIKSRENLEKLMTDVKLREVWDSKRPLLYKSKDKALSLVFGQPTEQDMHEAFLKLLDDRITASVENEVVSMDVEWPDADIAMSLAEGVVARFLKMRHDMELTEILEAVNTLERNVENSRKGIEEAVGRMQKVFNAKEREIEGRTGKPHHARKSRVIAIRKPIGIEQADPATEDLRRKLQDREAALSSLKRAFDQRVKKAEEELANLRSSLGPEHPDVIGAKRTLEQVSQPPAEVVALQAEVTRLMTQMGNTAMASAGKDSAKVEVQQNVGESNDEFDMMRVPVSDELFNQMDKDPEIASIMDDLKRRQDAHDNLLQRLVNARMVSETANVAFEYRYIMTMPPVYPKKPVKPNLPLLIVGGLFVAGFLGVCFAVAADVASKRVLEPWQLERFLNLKVLGEVDES